MNYSGLKTDVNVLSNLRAVKQLWRKTCARIVKLISFLAKPTGEPQVNSIDGSIESVDGNTMVIRRLGKRISLRISDDKAVFDQYEDWLYLQEKKGPPGSYENLWKKTEEKQRKIWEFIGIHPDDHVIDIGFRDGFNLKELGTMCHRVAGIEVNQHSVDHALSLDCEVYREDIQQGSCLDGSSFDVIILCDVLEHCFDPEKVIKECFRLLKSDGRMVIEIPFESTLLHPTPRLNPSSGHFFLIRSPRCSISYSRSKKSFIKYVSENL